MAEYIALIHKDADSAYGASFPEFPGAVTAAPALDELRTEAEEVLALHLEGMIEDGDSVPEPTSLDGQIDRHASQHGLTRSGFLVRAAKKEMDVESK